MTFVAVALWNLAALVPIGLGAWSVFGVLALYWFENLCTGLAQYCKLREAERHREEETKPFPPSAFFALHYGLFTLVHGVLVLAFFGFVAGGLWEDHAGWWISALVVAGMQVLHYRTGWHSRGGWAHAGTAWLMAEPYARVAVLHVVVIAGGWLALAASEPRAVLLAFAVVKLAAELAIAAVARRRREAAGASPMENFVSALDPRKGRSHAHPH